MGAKLLAAIEALKKTPWVVLALLFASLVGGLAQFTSAFKDLAGLVHPAKPDPRAELAKLGIPFTPAAMAKAAADGDARAVGLLLDGGMAADADGATPPPLVVAAKGGFVDMARRLRDAGAKPAVPGDADTALEAAVKAHHPEVVKLFLEKPLPAAAIRDAYIDAAVASEVTSLQLLAPRLADPRATAHEAIAAILEQTPGRQLPMSVETSELAAAHPGDLKIWYRDGSDHDPRDLAAIRAVLSLKPSLDAVDGNGQTLLTKAVGSDAPRVVAALLAAGANPRVPALCQVHDAKALPLSCAVVRGTLIGMASTRALLAGKAPVNAPGPDGATPLMLALGNGDKEVARVLVAAGADPNARDAKGRTAADYARARGNLPRGTQSSIN